MEAKSHYISFFLNLSNLLPRWEKNKEINEANGCLIGLICPALNAPAICSRYNHNAALIELFEGSQLARVISE